MVRAKIIRHGALCCLGLLALLGCQNDADWFSVKPPANAHLSLGEGLREPSPAAPTVFDPGRVPVPSADGPKLAAIGMRVPVRAAPNAGADVIGTLRLGTRVARSAEPIGTDGCAGGWYAVRPLGFVCGGDDATTDLEHPIARAIQVEPNQAWPMPYRYGFIRSIAPNYLRVPTKDEQLKYEMRLDRHLRNWKRLGSAWDVLDVGANDVPLDVRGVALGKIPDHARPLGLSERFGGSGNDTVPWWLADGRRIPNLSAFRAPSYAVIANRIKRHAGVAMIGSFVADDRAQNRRFAITTDARLIPADKIKAHSGSPFHGFEISEIGLPVAFAFAERTYQYEQTAAGAFEQRELLERRSLVALNGSVRERGKERWVQTRDGRWLNSSEIRTIVKPSTLPNFANKKVRWIDISLLQQTLVLYEGNRPVYATLVSTGRDGLGEPGKTLSTPQGVFRVYQKHVTTTMDSDVADSEFELRDVPWVMYFQSGYALHGAYWHDDFGHARSHGCVNLAPIDARYVFRFSAPEVPEHWHSANATSPFEAGTLINIHP
ncbi:MAG TPA: L,D-transpeptidase family protein [Polyangiaceae bacterium]|nr:L,D-transpeptidase family protein [Polyangiaceae bacterium]